MSATDLILFSGGPDSTILLKHFLQQKIKVRVLYIEMGWALRTQFRINLQDKVVENVLHYLKNKYGTFEFSRAGIYTSMASENETNYFGKDDQWCAFFGAMFCREYGIKKMWTGNFTCTEEVVKARDGKTQEWLTDGSMDPYIDAGSFFTGKYKFCTPKSVFKGKGIDAFKTKKQAWDSLEMDLKKMVRSCQSDKWFCGNCAKCWTSKKFNLRDEKGNPL